MMKGHTLQRVVVPLPSSTMCLGCASRRNGFRAQMKHQSGRGRTRAVKVEANELNKWYACRSMRRLERCMQAGSAYILGFCDA